MLIETGIPHKEVQNQDMQDSIKALQACSEMVS